jgi:NADH-quinone oxidoreductase subunit L
MFSPATTLAVLLLLPLASAALIALFFRRNAAAAQAISVTAASLFAALAFYAMDKLPPLVETSAAWLVIGDFNINISFLFNDLARLMLAVVAIVGLCVHVFSIGYMRDAPARPRYFAGLSLFMFSMSGIVLAGNLYMLFIFWELVGFSSWLLIAHDFHRQAAADASKKAFITNRVGDFGFLLGIIAAQYHFNTTNLTEIAANLSASSAALPAFIPILLFCGAVGKSAQFPLHVWLPDAMEGPTPVSALIHAATMVAAGIYMLCRLEPLYINNTAALNIILYTGVFTALYAALCAIIQTDIKKILAYSTLSQLGYMTAAFGLGGLLSAGDAPRAVLYTGAAAAMFHLTTHAFFKALLFLGSGSVIAGNHHEQNIFNMGGLRRKMPLTFATFTVGVAAISGLPFLSGFFSKDAILALALANNKPVFALLAATAILTAFYMTRLWRVAFLGAPRSETAARAHETSPIMTTPLLLLALLAVAGGYIVYYPKSILPDGGLLSKIPAAHGAAHTIILTTSLVVLLLGAASALLLYRQKQSAENEISSGNNAPLPADPFQRRFPALHAALSALQRLPDAFYNFLISKVQQPAARLLDAFDRLILAGLILRGGAGLVGLLGIGARALHTGRAQTVLYWFLLGAAFILLFLI